MEDACPQFSDGQHRYGLRRWLSRDDAGRSLDATVKGNWFEVWACVCSQRAPSALIPSLEAGLEETKRVKSRAWGLEQALQTKLDL